MTEHQQKGGMPGWVLGVCGCLLALLLLIIGVAAIGFFSVKTFVEDMGDPEARDRKALAMLGAEALPNDYRSALALRIPFIIDMVVIYDQTATSEDIVLDESGSISGSFEDLDSADFGRALFYMLIKVEDEEEEDPWDLDFRVDEQLASGEFEVNGQKIRYQASRGHQAGEQEGSTIIAEMTIECPDQGRRAALWFETVAQRTTPDDLAGSPADERALEQMMAHFRVCSAGS